MKRFHDVKLREEQKSFSADSKAEAEGAFDSFWENKFAQPEAEKTNSKPKPTSNTFIHRLVFWSGLTLCLIVLSLVTVYSIKAKIEVSAKNSSRNIENALEYLNQGEMDQAISEAEKARAGIKETKLYAESIGQGSGYLSMITPKSSRLLEMERLLNATGYLLEGILDIKKQFGGNLKNNVAHAAEKDNFIFDVEKNTEVFLNISRTVLEKIKLSETVLAKIDVSKLPEQENNINRAKIAIRDLKTSLDDLNDFISNDLVWLSGQDGQDKKVLLVFQNNGELRGGSGGSFGSFGIMNFSGGRLEGIDIGKNIFKIDQDFRRAKTIDPPEELAPLVSRQWVMKDSGWAIDGQEAFTKMSWFYEEETGENVDGVMVLDTTAFEQILKLIGPIEMPSYGLTISDQNFRHEVEEEVHVDYFSRDGSLLENEPKKIIKDMVPEVMSRLFASFENNDKALEFLNVGARLLKNKHILLTVKNEQFQKRLNRYNYSGKAYLNDYEYLYINNSNVAGAKSSINVISNILLESKLSADGTITDKLHLEREHNGDGQWPDGINKNFVRILLPKGGELKDFKQISGDFKTYSGEDYVGDGNGYKTVAEAGRSEIKFWMNTSPKEKSSAELTYVRKTAALDSEQIIYPVLFQKQPGALYDNITYRLELPSGYIPGGNYNFDRKTRILELKIKLESDKLLLLNLYKE